MALIAEQPGKDEQTGKPERNVDWAAKGAATSSAGAHAAGGERRADVIQPSDSTLGGGLAVEGKIEGTGNFRVAGRFKGNVNVKGDVTVEPGAAIEGEVKADSVIVGGDVRGQLVCKSHVELTESGTLIGDLKAGSLTVAAGSKMRGRVEFG